MDMPSLGRAERKGKLQYIVNGGAADKPYGASAPRRKSGAMIFTDMRRENLFNLRGPRKIADFVGKNGETRPAGRSLFVEEARTDGAGF